jgi:hypothetical protein
MILTALLLCGCAPEETFETVTDVAVMMPLAQPREIRVSLPGEAAMPAVESDSGRLYLCEDYEICIQTLEGGDLSTTIQTVTGYDKEALTVMERLQDDLDRLGDDFQLAGQVCPLVNRQQTGPVGKKPVADYRGHEAEQI